MASSSAKTLDDFRSRYATLSAQQHQELPQNPFSPTSQSNASFRSQPSSSSAVHSQFSEFLNSPSSQGHPHSPSGSHEPYQTASGLDISAILHAQSAVDEDWEAELLASQARSSEYLTKLLSLSSDEDILEYLARNTYTDDVWGLPPEIKETLDQAKDGKDYAREKALRRLRAIRNHLHLDD